ncbi:MAG: hypothetical protein ACI4SM_04045 [Candidatus Gastranaerophilaceae bacterium]
MQQRRWYDEHKEAKAAFELLKNLDDNTQKQLANDLIEVIEQIKDLHKEGDIPELSLGLPRVLGLYQETINQRRWYDNNDSLKYAIKLMSTLPTQDFINIMEGLSVSLTSD